ncbi:hypothetical protein [Algoriphagus confluentis]|uniref:Lipoprotein n=1 Tax=Algoriphagus confluentis TaxID=1697556 RepID=A0ABQ6PII4_9BACT|nr:hypothetical protein Aconfl_01250 [Algoriphagus confluentis]
MPAELGKRQNGKEQAPSKSVKMPVVRRIHYWSLLLNLFWLFGKSSFSIRSDSLSVMFNFYLFRNVFFFAICALFLGSCVNLRAVGDFALSSSASIGHYENLGYSFSDHCTDRCRDEAIRTLEIKLELNCPCDTFFKADSVTGVFYQTIQHYLNEMGGLAGKDLTSYKTQALFGALTAQQFGPIRVSESEVGAYAAVSDLIARIALTGFRKKKTSKYLEEANQPIQTLLDKFSSIISNDLKGELRFKKARLYSQYMNLKMGNTLDSDFESQSAVRTYYTSLSEIERKEKLLDVYAQSLKKIAQGHQELYEKRDQLSFKELTQSMLGYSEEIQKLYKEFNQLNR